jgi:choice-of-anchor B domain-containing protein
MHHHGMMKIKEKFWRECHAEHLCPNENVRSSGPAPCVNGYAGEYPCCNTDMLAFISIPDLGAGGDGNDIWGWTDPQTGHEIAIACEYDGTAFVDVSDPINPSVLGFLKTHTVGSSWRDAKVYKNFAYIISEASNHGMQVFDLTTLRSIKREPVLTTNRTAIPQLQESAFYGQFGSSHNLVINEDTGFAYSVGSRTCSAGLHMVNIQDPLKPTFAGCYSADGYVHDAQCVNYNGPDHSFDGKEVCYCYDEDTLTVVDVTTKSSPITISRTPYAGSAYTHQGWLLPEWIGGKQYLLMDDELDEMNGPNKHTRTMLWDVSSPRAPKLVNSFYSTETVIDHNLYTLKDRAYLSNYCGGLRILDISSAPTGMREVGYFDVAPDCSTTTFKGSWSSYVYFKSGTLVVNSIDRGMFVVKYNGASEACQ